MQQHVEIGIGRALRRARESRGKTLEEVSRETRMRVDQVRAIEQEWFGALGGEVYARGFLRSYARYLGLNADKVVGAYERASGLGEPGPAPVEQAPTVAPTEALELTERKRPNWLLAGAVAIIVLSAAAAIGIFGRTDSVPETADLQPPPTQPIAERPVEVGVQAFEEAEIAVSVDGGEPETHALGAGDGIAFEGTDTIHITAPEGGMFDLIVNGHRIELVGESGAPFEETYTPDHFRDAKTREDDRSTRETPAA